MSKILNQMIIMETNKLMQKKSTNFNQCVWNQIILVTKYSQIIINQLKILSDFNNLIIPL